VTSRDARLDKLSSTLTARERALLVLRSWKAGQDEDPAWRFTMPEHQVDEFNRLIGLMNGVNRWLGIYLMYLRQDSEKLSLLHIWLTTVLMWQFYTSQIVEFIEQGTKELVTEIEYRELEAQAREEYLPVDEAAELLTARHDGFTDADLEPEQDAHYEPIVRPEAWRRVKAEKGRELARLVKDGALEGKGRGCNLTVRKGPLYDRLGEPVPMAPEWAQAYEVVPDDRADDVAWQRSLREQAREAFDSGPREVVVYLPELANYPDLAVADPSKVDEIVRVKKVELRDGVLARWRELRAVEVAVQEVAEAFGGEYPALPDVRAMIDGCREELDKLRGEAERFVGPMELEEPSEEELSLGRRLVERG